MTGPLETADEEALIRLIAQHPDGVQVGELEAEFALSRRTLQARLRRLVLRGVIARTGAGRGTRYRVAAAPEGAVPDASPSTLPLSPAAEEVRAYVRRPITERRPVGYDRQFLDAYRPNESAYLDTRTLDELAKAGARPDGDRAAGTFARRILDRLLIDLSWSSSRLEGNTYSLLDTENLLRRGQQAEGKAAFETQMILNHKSAIEFLVEGAADIGFDRYTILGLHALLSENLLGDPAATGRLRTIPVRIEGSVFHPLEVPQLIEECFQQILDTAAAISNPFEQSFFVLVHLPYLQPFDDVNKRVSRLAANIPLIRGNLSPLSFLDLPADLYVQGVLAVYELNRIEVLRDLYIWAYRRSAEAYGAVRRSLGEPDPFRLQYRDLLREAVARVVRDALPRHEADADVEALADEAVPPEDRARFRQVVRIELEALHEGNIARYRVRPSDYEAWRAKQ